MLDEQVDSVTTTLEFCVFVDNWDRLLALESQTL